MKEHLRKIQSNMLNLNDMLATQRDCLRRLNPESLDPDQVRSYFQFMPDAIDAITESATYLRLVVEQLIEAVQ